MARSAFRRQWTRIVPQAADPPFCLICSGLLMFGLFAFWQPMAGEIWNVSEVFESGILCGLYAFGWALLLFANFVINYFDLSGLRQVWLGLGGRSCTKLLFTAAFLYQWFATGSTSRGPSFWATPTMTVAHLVFALMTTG